MGGNNWCFAQGWDAPCRLQMRESPRPEDQLVGQRISAESAWSAQTNGLEFLAIVARPFPFMLFQNTIDCVCDDQFGFSTHQISISLTSHNFQRADVIHFLDSVPANQISATMANDAFLVQVLAAVLECLALVAVHGADLTHSFSRCRPAGVTTELYSRCHTSCSPSTCSIPASGS